MGDPRARPTGAFRVTRWVDGLASFEAEGGDRREALEAGLRAVLALAIDDPTGPAENDGVRSAPIRGEGVGLPALFVELVEDLLDQIADFGILHDVSLDGVLRQDRDGFVAWGYVAAPVRPTRPAALPRLLAQPDVQEEGRFVLRATLARE